jgi:uncharacterized alkaline shock family protein YloU
VSAPVSVVDAGADAVRAPAAERGTTTVADRVVAAVAARAAVEVPGVGGAARRVLGVPLDGGTGAEHLPQVEVTTAGETVALDVRLSVTYPAPVRSTVERVRRYVTARVGELVGRTVGVTDVTVVALPLPVAPGRVVR